MTMDGTATVRIDERSTPTGPATITAERAFEPHRAMLRGLAYRLLGDWAAAEDAVQETYLRWHQADRVAVAEPRAWLITACSRLCIDSLRSARHRRETYVGPWLPDMLVEQTTPHDPVERQESLSIAYLLLLEHLKPAERAAYVLREVFELDYDEIARALGKTAVACRQVVSRAARRLATARETGLRAPDRALSAAFATALAKGDMPGLLRLLGSDAVLLSDGGGKVIAALNPIAGADRVARFLLGLRRKRYLQARLEPVTVNGAPGCLVRLDGKVSAVFALAARGGRIEGVYMMRNPDKLRFAPAG